MATPTVRRYTSSQALTQGAAENFVGLVREAIDARGTAHVVLTGGTIADAFHRRVAELIDASAATADQPRIAWNLVHWWWGDERYVASDSADRNELQARQALLNRIPVVETNVHPIGALSDGTLDHVASSYRTELDRLLGPQPFDLVLLGIGPDAHVASLFPHAAELTATGGTVAVADSPKPPPQRVSLTFDRLTNTREAWILASGESKREAVEELLSRHGSVTDTPARGVHAVDSPATLWTDIAG